MKLNKLKTILTLSEPKLIKYLNTELTAKNYKLTHGKDNDYIYGRSTVKNKPPVLLVAHMDTVYQTPGKVYYDPKEQVMWASTGLGADDRAGVYGILEIIKTVQCDVLFTSGEEKGGIGAHAFVEDKVNNPGYKMLIELDRRGSKDAVFYSVDSKDFKEYICGWGFKENTGSFSDISVISPEWKVNSVNLSIGYRNEHTRYEHLNLKDMFETIVKVSKMLQSEIPGFEYKEVVPKWGNWKSYSTYSSYDWSKYETFPSTPSKEDSFSSVVSLCELCEKVEATFQDDEGVHMCDGCHSYYNNCCMVCFDYVDQDTGVYCGEYNVCNDCFHPALDSVEEKEITNDKHQGRAKVGYKVGGAKS